MKKISSFKKFSETLYNYKCKKCGRLVVFTPMKKEDFQMAKRTLCRKCVRKELISDLGK